MEELVINPFVNDFDKLKDVVSIKGIPKFKENPFTKDFKYTKIAHYDKKVDAKVLIGENIVTNRDIKKDNLVFAEKLYKDSTPFTKAFLEFPLDFKSTKSATFKMLVYIMKNMNLNSDIIIINPSMMCDILDMSLSTSYNCIVELVKAGFIVRHTEDNLYWINPHAIFRGDRKKIRLNK